MVQVSKMNLLSLSTALLFLVCTSTRAFRPMYGVQGRRSRIQARRQDVNEISFLLREFTTASGELLDPYKILKVPRDGSEREIKQSYRALSRKYHPDRSDKYHYILPGSCNNEDEVREHWERVRLSYEILSDPKMRSRYNRHENLAHPGEALRRAALDVCSRSLQDIGISVLSFGTFCFDHLTKDSHGDTESSHTEPIAILREVFEAVGASLVALFFEGDVTTGFHKPKSVPAQESRMWMEVDKEQWVQLPV